MPNFRKIAAAVLLATGAASGQPLEGTVPLAAGGDLAMEMVASIDRYLMRRLAESPARRSKPTPESRERLKKLIGAVDARLPFDSPSLEGTFTRPAKVAEGPGYEVFAVRWPVLPGMDGEGLLFRPKAGLRAAVVAIPDAAWTPEQFVGLEAGGPADARMVRRLAESGCMVLVPYLIDRDDAMSGNPAVRFTNQPHREFIHRMAYEMGRHIIGYEVQKVLAAVDWFTMLDPRPRIGVFGYGEGGLLALLAAALDERIHAAVVSGYFEQRERVVWSQPIYRNIWSQLEQFGDAELAALVAPRPVVVEASAHPAVNGPPPEREGRRGAATGRIETPPLSAVEAEVARARQYGAPVQLVQGSPGGDAAMALLARELRIELPEPPAPIIRISLAAPRAARQFRQMVDYTQRLMHLSEFRRKEYMSRLDTSTPERLEATAGPYRKDFWEEIQGRMPAPDQPLRAATRRIYGTEKFTGYEVSIPVWGEVFAYGILLLPKDLKPGERRPVVVAQHGLEGRPQFLIAPPDERSGQIYARFAAVLAERGFVVFAPQNPYIGTEAFRVLMRKANPVKLSLFSFIIGQHSRIIDWLETQPFVDKARIGFYGLSYGGKTAMRVPAVETRYALSICSGDFNEWVWKVVSSDFPFSYMFTQEYDMLEFNLGLTFNYAEQAALIAPRPFMVERGHKDGVGIDEWVSLEYAKVRRLYTYLGIPERTTIEYFNGPHQIHGVGTYDFLHRHLHWPAPR